MKREQIINQYISVYEGHAMEKEELEIMLNGFADDIVNSLQPSLPDNLELNMTRTKLELNEIETLTHLVRAKAVKPGPFQGLYKGILSKLNKMFDEEYAERKKGGREMKNTQSALLTWQDIDIILKAAESYDHEIENELRDWSMDEDQMGISHPYLSKLTREDFCREILRRYMIDTNRMGQA